MMITRDWVDSDVYKLGQKPRTDHIQDSSVWDANRPVEVAQAVNNDERDLCKTVENRWGRG